MSKSVLISIRPKWCAKIESGEKTVEVRKSCPQIDPPFKCYIYQSGKNLTKPVYGSEFSKNGYVIGEFVCDWIVYLDMDSIGLGYYGEDKFLYIDTFDGDSKCNTCLTRKEILDYTRGKRPYGWHISELVIYDRPKELGEFKRWNRTEENSPCAHTKWLYPPCEKCKECNLTRPPQSYMYVEELE